MPRLRLLLALLVVAALTAWPAIFSPAFAQTAADYGALAGAAAGGAGDPETPPEEGEPEGDGPGLADYGAVAETYRADSAIAATQQQVGVFQQKARRIFGAAGDYGTRLDNALSRVSPTGESVYFLGVALFTAVLLAIGRAGAMIFALYIALPIMRRVQKPNPAGMVDKLPVLATRVALQIAGLIIMLVIALAVGSGFYVEEENTIKTVIAVAAAFVLVQMVDVLWRMVISPYLPAYRIPAFSDAEARRLYRWLTAGATVGVGFMVFVAWLVSLEVDDEVVALTSMAGSALSLLIVLGLVRGSRRAISSALLGGAPRAEATWIAAAASIVWAPVFLTYMIFAFFESSYRLIMGLELGMPLLAGAFIVLLAALVVYAVTIYAIERMFRRARAARAANEAAARAEAAEREAAETGAIRDQLRDVDDGGEDEGGGAVVVAAPFRAPRRGMRTFEDLARRVASLFALGAGIYALIRVWAGPAAFAPGSPLDLAQDLIDVLFLGYIAYHAARIWMDQKIEEEGGNDDFAGEPGDEGGAKAAASRIATILPLFRSFVLLVIGVTVALLALTKLGVNIAPLLGGAGVVGLAIGFGAQSLVRDILSGVFFLSDDAFRKGEYIDIGGVKGTVEKISLRSFQLRHHLGALNTVPFGEIKHLTNYSRDWVMMKLPLRLTYDTDVDKVRKLVKKLGEKLLEHPLEGHKFVQPLKSQGVYMMEDSAMIIRVKFMTRPGDQWTTRKLVYQEIRNLFEKEGIHFAHKEVTVRIPGLDDPAREGQISAQEQKAIGAAARRAVEEAEPAPAMADDR
ncbi:MAG: mechanosensitive ion channel family protein [Pikeienuella sp.]|uniref:mechanosensitive ion channel family protein n=1 Tax=Pikeienuella sp. TaxID=2831957 RepID=UPI00391C70BB